MTTALEQLKSIQAQLEALKAQVAKEHGSESYALEQVKNAIDCFDIAAEAITSSSKVIKETQEILDKPVYKDISGMTIEQIRWICNEWRSTLKPGDSVLVMSALVGWSDSDCNFTTTVKTTTPKRLVLSDDCCTVQKTFHRDGGRILNGVNGYGDWLLMPPFLNPKDLQELRTAAETVARRTLLDNVPASKLKEALELLKPYQ